MASADYEMLKEGRLRVIIKGSLDTDTTGQLWPEVVRKVAEANPETLAVDAGAVEYCDGAGIGLLLELKRRQEQKNGQFQIEGLKPEFSQLMTMFAPTDWPAPNVYLRHFGVWQSKSARPLSVSGGTCIPRSASQERCSSNC
ncbi:MAG: STAS domain-containing protein [Planctomycetota bacterium]|jgi:anti-anti-sigma factor